jgi:hypothetical protein
MTGKSCAFILTKSHRIYPYSFLHMYNYAVIGSLTEDGYERCLKTYCKLRQVFMVRLKSKGEYMLRDARAVTLA